MSHHHGPDTQMLSRIAEEVMREMKFMPYPPHDAIEQAAAAPEAPTASGIPDLSELPWTSIDNPESRDLDQIEVTEKVEAGIRLLVGIADVDAFVAKGSPIDRFACANTTSVYTGVRTFPMLPDRLSFDVTSLLAERARLAIVFETVIGPDGSIGAHKTYRALVRNHAKLDYPAVSAWLDGGPIANGLQNRPD